ncbi:DUF1878 family protein [Geobacillus sp. FSL W8-0032]|uniref:DUF1878 domain-containing protein n=2 Tax=Geobacillus TaxID=129337 RepID=A0A679FQ77_9BACL|nr:MULTISPECIES: DUF1878 family protein [Geobacillus]KYD28665.1 hypothetical protein B4113_3462 [Geobacillus sp. B4113_201601]MEB3751435.1 hypothetical protein [Geobacillus icigianus]BBW97169.1 hypothetical protein GsuE55_20020 [Geobacillus subterraneus]
MRQESLEQRVERLEFYIDLLRDFAVDPETFAIWDWVISRKLNKSQVDRLMKTAKEFNQAIKIANENGNQPPKFEEFSRKIIEIVHFEDDPADEETVLQFLKRIKNSHRYLSDCYLTTTE